MLVLQPNDLRNQEARTHHSNSITWNRFDNAVERSMQRNANRQFAKHKVKYTDGDNT